MCKLIIDKNSNAKGRKPNTTGCGIYLLLNNPVNIGKKIKQAIKPKI